MHRWRCNPVGSRAVGTQQAMQAHPPTQANHNCNGPSTVQEVRNARLKAHSESHSLVRQVQAQHLAGFVAPAAADVAHRVAAAACKF